MNNNTKIIIVGTSHQLQCATKEHSIQQIQKFRSTIKKICQEEGIENIVEEMSNEGLSKHGAKNTIPFEVAAELSIKHCYTDLTEEQLACLGLSDGHIVNYSRAQPTNELVNQMRELLTDKLLHPVRERYWLANILRINIFPTLFICGSDHGERMQDLVNSIAYGPVYSWLRICPSEIPNQE